MNKILGSGVIASAFGFGLSVDTLWGAVAGVLAMGCAAALGWRLGTKR